MQVQWNLKQLKRRCNAKISDFWQLGQAYTCPDGMFTYIDNGAPVLAVAHLDTVNDDQHFYHNQFGKEHVVYSTALDDRLGAYIILDLLPQLVGKGAYDILLTEGEEVGRSTAYYFEGSHEYNWMFQFDRRGEDVVMYQYDSKENRALLKDYGFKPDIGSFTDISSMDHLKVSGFNFGTGYYDNHSIRSYAELDVTERMVRKFVRFFKENKDKHIPAPPVDHRVYNKPWNYNDYKDYNSYNQFEKYDIGDCVDCGQVNVDIDTDGLCKDCSARYDASLMDYPLSLTSKGRSWNKCMACGHWRTDVDSFGLCPDCYGNGSTSGSVG
jgi:hypothetical protein